MSATQGTERATLERRYRRLLRSYPPSHRAAHREEMLGVLLDAARPGQRMPGVTQTVNLVACGLAIRARRALIGEPWRDALAVVSLIAPVLMFIVSTLRFAEVVRLAMAVYHYAPQSPSFWTMDLVSQLAAPAAVTITWLAVAILALSGRRRAAAAIASAPLALDLASLLAASGPVLGFASSVPFTDTPAAIAAGMLVNLVIAVLVWPLAIVSWKGRVSRA